MEYCLTEPGEAEAALRLAVTVPGLYWWTRSVVGEGRRWLDRALAQATAPTALRARALLVDSYLAFWQGDAAAGVRLLDEGEELARRLDASTELAHAAFLRGMGALFADDLPVAVELFDQAWTTLSRDPDQDLDLYFDVLTPFGVAAGLAGDHDRARALRRRFWRSSSPEAGISTGPSRCGWVASRPGCGETFTRPPRRCWRACGSNGHGRSDDPYGIALCLEVLAWITADQQRHRRAATLLGAADALFTDVGTPITSSGHLVGHHDACERQIRDALGDAAFADAFHHGQALTYDDAIAYALDEPLQPTAASK